MVRELIFLVSAEASPESEIELGTPWQMKVQAGQIQIQPGQDPCPFIVFSTESLGRQFIAGGGTEELSALLPFSALKPEHVDKAKKQNVVLFEQPEQVVQYLQDCEHFAFAPHVFPIEEAQRRIENAL